MLECNNTLKKKKCTYFTVDNEHLGNTDEYASERTKYIYTQCIFALIVCSTATLWMKLRYVCTQCMFASFVCNAQHHE